MSKKLLYLRRPLNQPSPQDDRHLVYIGVGSDIHGMALKAANALGQVNEIGQSCGGEITHFLVRYRSYALARKSAIAIRDLDLQRNYGERATASDSVFRDMIAEEGDTLQLHYSTVLLNEPDINNLLAGILNTQPGAVFTSNRRVRQLIKKHFSAFNPRAIVSIEPHIEGVCEPEPDLRELAEATKSAHAKVVAFLRTILNQCSDTRPVSNITPASTHAIRIGPDLDVSIDGTEIQLNEARRASLLTLALLGTNKVSLDEFAGHYCVIPPSTMRAVNLPNIFTKATKWLADSLPDFTVKKTATRIRQLTGISIVSEASEETMRDFLRERQENAENE